MTTTGLRKRKKDRTRAAIQQHALWLFRQRGYDGTTVEQIAAAAEISASTFFRYFPTKEDVLILDEYDPLLIETFNAQPAELGPILALRSALRSVFGNLSADELAVQRERAMLIMTIPEVRATFLERLARMMRMIGGLVAKRVGRDPDDFAVRTLAGALIGVWISVLLNWVENPSADLFASLDEAMAHLEAGLPLGAQP